MESSDKIVANQIQEFNDGLRLLTSHLSNTRQDFTKFSAETKTRGVSLLAKIFDLRRRNKLLIHVFRQPINLRSGKTCRKSRNENLCLYISNFNLY